MRGSLEEGFLGASAANSGKLFRRAKLALGEMVCKERSERRLRRSILTNEAKPFVKH